MEDFTMGGYLGKCIRKTCLVTRCIKASSDNEPDQTEKLKFLCALQQL